MKLRPGAPLRGDIRILFAVEPPGTALLIAVLHGLDVVEDQFPEAVMASADMLRRIRAGQAPEAAAHTYAHTRSFLEEFYPGDVGAAGSLLRHRLPERSSAAFFVRWSRSGRLVARAAAAA